MVNTCVQKAPPREEAVGRAVQQAAYDTHVAARPNRKRGCCVGARATPVGGKTLFGIFFREFLIKAHDKTFLLPFLGPGYTPTPTLKYLCLPLGEWARTILVPRLRLRVEAVYC